jgi:hypothetical protein
LHFQLVGQRRSKVFDPIADAATIEVLKYQLFVLRDSFRAAAADAPTVRIVKLSNVALQERFGVDINEEASMVG